MNETFSDCYYVLDKEKVFKNVFVIFMATKYTKLSRISIDISPFITKVSIFYNELYKCNLYLKYL